MIAAVLLSVFVPVLQASYVPQRVYDMRQKTFSDFETMLADLARADAVFVGEQHDDPNTHRLELAIVEGLTRRGVPVVVAMEMFERDVQGAVDQYAAGTMTEEQFLKESRPWPHPTCRSACSTRGRKGSAISKPCWRISRAPTRCSSASSTTIRIPTAWSWRSSRG